MIYQETGNANQEISFGYFQFYVVLLATLLHKKVIH